MTVAQMDETFTAALRELLVAQVRDAHGPRRIDWRAPSTRRGRWIAGAAATMVVAAGAGGIAGAAGVFSTPGETITTLLATPVPASGTGTQTVELGTPPAGANAINISLTCLSAGTFYFPGGSSLVCDGSDVTHSSTGVESVPLSPGETSVTIKATPGARWSLVATYATLTTTVWGVNASGQTYGVENQNGAPDLIAVVATNHREGYAYSKQLMFGPAGSPPTTTTQALAQSGRTYTVPVYESDGKTRIGKFVVGGGHVTQPR